MRDVFPERDMILQRRATPWTEYHAEGLRPSFSSQRHRRCASCSLSLPLSLPISKSNEKTYPFPPYTASRTH